MKRYFINEDYPAATWDDLMGVTKECARRVLNDEEFAKWCEDRAAKDAAYNRAQEAYNSTHYFPGCYGDPLADC